MKNANELRNNLAEVFDQLRTGALEVDVAAELANIAGKMVSSAKAQVAYYELRGEKPVISFLAED